MTKDEIIRMAREAGFSFETGQDLRDNIPALERFAALVAAHEREKLAEQEPFDMNDHPPHRLCECRKCMEYFTPLPDCDAFAASGKPIAEQPVSQEYQDHLVNQSFDWAAMAAKHQLMEGYRIGLAEMREKCAKVCDEYDMDHIVGQQLAEAIRAIKFEGDTGFRPVSEMVAEHKQDPKKAAAIEKAKMRKAEQEPVAVVEITYGREPECYVTGNIDDFPEGVFKLYASPVKQAEQEPVAWVDEHGLFSTINPNNNDWLPLYTHPVRTKDLTDDEIEWLVVDTLETWNSKDTMKDFARAVIAADREKNK